MKKLLRHLTNAPIAVALAFLLVGAPSAPMADLAPSSGDAHAAMVSPFEAAHPIIVGIGVVAAIIGILSAVIWVYEAVSGDDVKENITEWFQELEEAERESNRRRAMQRVCDLTRLMNDFVDDAGIGPFDFVPIGGDTLEMCENAGF